MENEKWKICSGKEPYGWDQFAIGQLVTVHYDPLDPNNSALVHFDELSSRALAPVPLMVAVIVFLALLMIELARNRRRPPAKPRGASL